MNAKELLMKSRSHKHSVSVNHRRRGDLESAKRVPSPVRVYTMASLCEYNYNQRLTIAATSRSSRQE